MVCGFVYLVDAGYCCPKVVEYLAAKWSWGQAHEFHYFNALQRHLLWSIWLKIKERSNCTLNIVIRGLPTC